MRTRRFNMYKSDSLVLVLIGRLGGGAAGKLPPALILVSIQVCTGHLSDVSIPVHLHVDRLLIPF
jgi:hypothetical protein